MPGAMLTSLTFVVKYCYVFLLGFHISYDDATVFWCVLFFTHQRTVNFYLMTNAMAEVYTRLV